MRFLRVSRAGALLTVYRLFDNGANIASSKKSRSAIIYKNVNTLDFWNIIFEVDFLCIIRIKAAIGAIEVSNSLDKSKDLLGLVFHKVTFWGRQI